MSRFSESLVRSFGEALRDYRMVEPGSRVLIALSGGKDSFTLMELFGHLGPQLCPGATFAVSRIATDVTCSGTIDPGELSRRAAALGMAEHNLFFPLGEEAGGRVDCFYCAMRRRTALFKLAFERGFDRIAFGHHQDDMVQTLLMNMVHHGNISTMAPVVRLFGGRITIIRPLIRVAEEECRRYALSQVTIPPGHPCAGVSAAVRRKTRTLVEALAEAVPGSKERLAWICLRRGCERDDNGRQLPAEVRA